MRADVANTVAFTQTPPNRRYPRALQVIGGIGCLVLVAALPLSSVVSGVSVVLLGLVFRALRLAVSHRRPR